MFEPLDYYENNFVGVMNLVKMMQQHSSCTEFIFSSSAAVYGEQDDCTEEFECLPISPYGESKLCGEMLLKSIAKANPKWKIISLRYFNPAGNHPSGIMGDNPAGSIPGNLFSVIQEVIIGKR
jgi:UDP-glucose 4-epimerase